ncbi:MAG: glutamine-hydrolyzing GMP synthase, partial [Bacteroidetes bacterium]|nr:glutamine-hydrolyzing GMP synthase [Bacteroidota bacterium]
MQEKILIVDFGSQYTQLIARRVRESEVYCEIVPFNKIPTLTPDIKGVILSGSPASVRDEGAPDIDIEKLTAQVPLLGVCYGAQLLAQKFGGKVEKSDKREYGRAHLDIQDYGTKLFEGVPDHSQIWMSHGDSITSVGDRFDIIAKSDSIPVAAFLAKDKAFGNTVYGIQFHPEVYHSTDGHKILNNFLFGVCGLAHKWTPASFVAETVAGLKEQIGEEHVLLGLSGGVDSSVAALLLQKAVGKNLLCIFVDNGLLRKNEFE